MTVGTLSFEDTSVSVDLKDGEVVTKDIMPGTKRTIK